MEEGHTFTCTIFSSAAADAVVQSISLSGEETTGYVKTIACTALKIEVPQAYYLKCISPLKTGPLLDTVDLPQDVDSMFVLCCRKGQDVEFDWVNTLDPKQIEAPPAESDLPLELSYTDYVKRMVKEIAIKDIESEKESVTFVLYGPNADETRARLRAFRPKPDLLSFNAVKQEYKVFFSRN